MKVLGPTDPLALACCTEILDVYKVMREEPRVMSPKGSLALRTHMTKFLTFWEAVGGHLVFKFHCAWHLVERGPRPTARGPRPAAYGPRPTA